MAKSFEKRLKIDLGLHCMPSNNAPLYICCLQFLSRGVPRHGLAKCLAFAIAVLTPFVSLTFRTYAFCLGFSYRM